MKQSPNCDAVFSKHTLKRVIYSTQSQQNVRLFLETFLSNTYGNVSQSKEFQQVFCGMYSPMYKINFRVLKFEVGIVTCFKFCRVKISLQANCFCAAMFGTQCHLQSCLGLQTELCSLVTADAQREFTQLKQSVL